MICTDNVSRGCSGLSITLLESINHKIIRQCGIEQQASKFRKVEEKEINRGGGGGSDPSRVT